MDYKFDKWALGAVALALVAIVAIWLYAKSANAPGQPVVTANPGIVAPMHPAPVQAAPAPPVEPEPQELHPAATATAVQEGINQAISMVRAAVVGISTPVKVDTAPNPTGLTFIEPFTGMMKPVGSGVLIDPRGYILTTSQTVGSAKQVQVTLFSVKKKHYQADVVSADTQTNLVLLKIHGVNRFPSAVLGNSDVIEIGDIVLAIGSPFGFSRTVSMGIISTNRRKVAINKIWYPDLIQTDAAINSGDDGGPLINIKGEVIGINMAYFIPNNHFTGIGFALPINDAAKVLRAGGL